jgi:hypothetical protein
MLRYSANGGWRLSAGWRPRTARMPFAHPSSR